MMSREAREVGVHVQYSIQHLVQMKRSSAGVGHGGRETVGRNFNTSLLPTPHTP